MPVGAACPLAALTVAVRTTPAVMEVEVAEDATVVVVGWVVAAAPMLTVAVVDAAL